MIASVLKLSKDDSKKLKIVDTYSIHKIIYSLFPRELNKTRDFLFLDQGGNSFYHKILIISRRLPKQAEYGNLTIQEIPDVFFNNDYYAFEVKVNVVKKDFYSRKTIPIKNKADLIDWFYKKSSFYGFEILQNSLDVREICAQQFQKGDQKITHNSATFIGKLKVLDKDKFKSSFENGIGKGKAFGFGLLQIVPLMK